MLPDITAEGYLVNAPSAPVTIEALAKGATPVVSTRVSRSGQITTPTTQAGVGIGAGAGQVGVAEGQDLTEGGNGGGISPWLGAALGAIGGLLTGGGLAAAATAGLRGAGMATGAEALLSGIGEGYDIDLETGGLLNISESIRWPWQTPTGEGFIAPWTDQAIVGYDRNGTAVYGQVGQIYPEYPASYLIAYQTRGLIPPIAKLTIPVDGRGGWPIAQLIDGKMATVNRNGVIKTWRPKKHVVISSNPRMSTLRKLDRVYKRTQKTVRKYAPKKHAATVTSPYLSAVERKALKAGG